MRHILLYLLLCCPLLAGAQEFEAKLFIRGADTLPYRILMPENYSTVRKYPLVVFMHGSGERGNDNRAQLTHGSALFLKDSVRKEFPAIVIFPQCAKNTSWATLMAQRDSAGNRTGFIFPAEAAPTIPSMLLYKLIDSLLASKNVDSKRAYVGGLSMGGMGTFDMLARFPSRFAAAFPICGAGNEALCGRYAKNTALWIFHGADDNVVPPGSSRKFYELLKQAGADVRYTEYPGVGHNSWDNAFAEPELLPWLFSHHL